MTQVQQPEALQLAHALSGGKLIDQDGNEHENFSTDYGFAGVLIEAIDTAIAAQATKHGEQP